MKNRRQFAFHDNRLSNCPPSALTHHINNKSRVCPQRKFRASECARISKVIVKAFMDELTVFSFYFLITSREAKKGIITYLSVIRHQKTLP